MSAEEKIIHERPDLIADGRKKTAKYNQNKSNQIYLRFTHVNIYKI